MISKLLNGQLKVIKNLYNINNIINCKILSNLLTYNLKYFKKVK